MIGALYLILGLLAWVPASVMFLRHCEQEWGKLDGDDYLFAALVGVLAGLLWPLTLLGITMHYVVKQVYEATKPRAKPR